MRRKSKQSLTGLATSWMSPQGRGSMEDHHPTGQIHLHPTAVRLVCPTASIGNWQHSNNSSSFQVFCGKIPRDVYEDELIPLFEKCGTIWDLRLMMDPLTNLNRGYAFVTFTTTEAAQEAVNQVMLERFCLYGFSQN